VLEEAERVADEVGLSQLTLACLAARLGVRQPSLYKHIDGMDGLQRGLAVRAKNELAAILARAAIGRERGDAITGSRMPTEHGHASTPVATPLRNTPQPPTTPTTLPQAKPSSTSSPRSSPATSCVRTTRSTPRERCAQLSTDS